MEKLKKSIFGNHAMAISTLVLCGMMLMFLNNLRPQFQKVEEDYKESRSVNLSQETDKQQLSNILITNGYVANQRDADFVADTLVARLRRGMVYTNLYDLKKRDYGKVPASVVEKEGVLTNKLALSCEGLELTNASPKTSTLDSKLNLKREGGNGKIIVRVYEKQSRGKLLDKILGAKKVYCKNVQVSLREYYVDGADHTEVVGYTKTDSKGRAVFKGLNRAYGYSVLPIKTGYEYGSSKGIVRGEFNKHKLCGKRQKFQFEQQDHCVQLIDNLTIKQIKNDGTITVRTPSEFKASVVTWFLIVVLAWWLLVLIMHLCKRNFDSVLIATATFLTGLCVIVMFAIHNPLTENLEGVVMAKGVIGGIVVVALFQLVDFVKLYQNQYRFGFDLPIELTKWSFSPFAEQTKWSRSTIRGNVVWYKKALAAMALVVTIIVDILILPLRLLLKPFIPVLASLKVKYMNNRPAPEGVGWLLLALFLTFLLFFFGKDVGGMKVNLALPGLPVFQPSEIVKYLILIFMAAFFTQKADFIVAYSQPNERGLRDKVKTLGWVIGGLLLLMFLYLFLDDLGPALVISVTFILLYSLVKSKVNLDNLTEGEKLKKIFTCDFAMLVYGAVSFAIFIIVGYCLAGTKISILFAFLWFICWILYGKFRLKQVIESALIFNVLVSIFVFGGVVTKNVDTGLGERFEQRTSMCVNTWGNLDINPDNPNYEQGKDATPVSNTQVANGLWAIATGGFAGEGLGNGNPNLIPAFQTDMILSSMAEQIGWLGLLFVMMAFSVLLWRVIVIGYQVGNSFAFFFCMGMAIVTAVQFFIIALGSSGMIPLTGITVPLLSYGRVSMILNLAALGVVLSLSKNIKHEQLTETQQRIRNRSVGDYNYTTGIVKYTYGGLAIFILAVWAFYGWGCFERNNTLVKPAYVLATDGMPMIEYNPRINVLIKEMRTGNIYDRNNELLATNDKANKRCYPFAEHLFFMIGDQNLGSIFSYNETYPIGYLAEDQHKSYLRGFDNLHDQNGQPTMEVTLYSDKVKASSKYLNYYKRGSIKTQLEDNRELVEYLKNGIHGRKLKKHNLSVQEGENDLYLTIDAKLQTDMQKRIEKYVQSTPIVRKNLLRISVVVLDAANGDLLTSANYPLPDYQRLREEASHGYSDNFKDDDWHSYSDRDLGLIHQTMPGSTAKVMSAIAGFQKLGIAAADKTYLVTKDDIIERGRAKEPYKGLPYKRHNKVIDNVDMWWAIVESSNCYFINLVNDNDLYWELDKVYEATGVSIGNIIPYIFTNKVSVERKNLFREKISENQSVALAKYAKRKEEGVHKNMNEGEWRWAWGQGYRDYELQASPLNMARVASAVVNKGRMPFTQYVLPKGKYAKKLRKEEDVKLMSSKSAELLKGYMKAESENQKLRNGITLPNTVGGKTGTPERYCYVTPTETQTLNDGWYMFFIEGQNGKHPLAVCVRMERGSGSPAAVRLTKEVVLKSLLANGYINQ